MPSTDRLPSSDVSAAARAPIVPGPVTLAVNDLQGVAEFYRTALGLTERADDESRVRLGTADRDLVVLEHAPDAVPAPQAAGLFHVAVLYPSRQALAEAIARVLESGARLDGASDHLVSEAVYLHDPEGNGIELYRDRPRDEWRTDAAGRLEMATLPLDLGELMQSVTRVPSSTIPADAVVGHVHLQVAEIATSRAFYADVLGFDVMVDGYPGALFVATGGYHHHVGLNVWNSAGRPATRGARGLRHATLLIGDEATLTGIRARLATADVTVVEQGDGAVTLHDPSGVTLRLALA